MSRIISTIPSVLPPSPEGNAATPGRSSGASEASGGIDSYSGLEMSSPVAPASPRPLTRRSALGVLASACLALAAPSGVLAATDASGDMATKGRELLLSGKPGEAVTALKEAARLDPANPWVFNLLGRAYSQAGQPYQAAESFRTALRIDPSDGYSRMMLDMLSQSPIPVPKGEGRPTRHARKSQLEEDAAREFQAYAASGKPPGQRLIVLDAGHGGTDKGVSGASGLAEKAVTLELAKKLAQALASTVDGKTGMRVLFTRETDHDQPLWARAATAGLFGADLFISLHCTASLPGHSGLELYTYAPEASDAQAQAVADMENGVTRFERSLPPRVPLPSAPVFLASWQTRRLAGASRLLAERLATELGVSLQSGGRGAPQGG
ncbi:MAG: N-acetylmuramoyl-L-alanine [Desulfovibrionaceae bacterium]|nr:MAG: N-acetylmuramoyl-L-alanine [Desulfovibrionaceae bacterium]